MTPEKLPEVKATLEEIKRVIPAEVNEDFFKTIYGEDGEVKTELEMRAKIQEDIEQHFSKQTDSKLYNKLAEALIENTKMDFPSDFLKRWIKLTNENPITEEQIEKEFPAFEKNLKWSLIVKKVSKENKVDVSTDEVKQRTADQIRQQMTSYGIGDMPPDEMDKFVSSMMARKDHSTQTRETLLEEKLFVYFKGQINTKDKKISLEEFNKQ
jgi:trigger factor